MEFRNTWHIMHLIITLLTGGLWLPVWVIIILINSSHNSEVAKQHNAKQMQELINQIKDMKK